MNTYGYRFGFYPESIGHPIKLKKHEFISSELRTLFGKVKVQPLLLLDYFNFFFVITFRLEIYIRFVFNLF